VPTCEETAGQGAVDLARAYGVPLDAWQEDIVRGILRETGGTWSASQAGLVVGRQNGNGQVLLALELYGLLVLGEQVLHTAHAVKTFSDAFRRLWAVIQTHDGPASSVRRHSQRIGAEYVELVSGARNAFTTRSASAGRGLAVDRLVVDEAEGLPAPEVGALPPTVFSRPHAQSLYFGTAPGVMHDSGVVRRDPSVRARRAEPQVGLAEAPRRSGSAGHLDPTGAARPAYICRTQRCDVQLGSRCR